MFQILTLYFCFFRLFYLVLIRQVFINKNINDFMKERERVSQFQYMPC